MNLEEIYNLLKTKRLEDKIFFSHPIKTKNKSIKLSIGRVWFNLLLPESFELIDRPIDKTEINKIIETLYEIYPVHICAETVNLINKESFKLATISPSSFDINSIIIPQFIIDKKNKLLSKKLEAEDFNKISLQLANEFLEYIKKEYGSGIYDIFKSKVKDETNWALLMIAKGSQVDIEGVTSEPILNSLDDGLTLTEFYQSASEARFTQFFKSKGAAEPGYLATKIAFANSNIILQDGDCGTKKYLKLPINKKLLSKLCGRYYLNETTNALEVIMSDTVIKETTILLRSPLYCKNQNGICSVCYGKLGEVLGTKKIGLLTASTVNSQGINKAMKARHETSQVSIKKANFIKDLFI